MFSLGPESRLRFSYQFRAFFGSAEVFRARSVVLFRIKNDTGSARLGITFKARGNSVQRNRTRRVIREWFRLARPALGSFDYNVVVSGKNRLEHPFARRLRLDLNEVTPKLSGPGERARA